MFNSILVVCVGNICRSPTGERLLRSLLPSKTIDSAGIGALVGHCADKNAILIAQQHGLSLNNHVAQQINAAMCRSYDLILVMEKEHIEALSNIAPEVRGKTMLFGHWLNQREIADPYRKSLEAFEHVYNMLDESAKKWADVLKS
ncbi:arsenate reductase/protein-tyrosine-phosphatase family protein [Serratia fonticola]|uniref:arsenate reductase/protein-tyrosine-phosphatase family protein n=1 Tax=Serratia fonticola TaxID=47917 RepID=UPI0021ADDA9A|nr:protein tyrosine phosphatase [Serratia fonticola]